MFTAISRDEAALGHPVSGGAERRAERRWLTGGSGKADGP